MTKVKETPKQKIATIVVMILCFFMILVLPFVLAAYAINKNIAKIEEEAKEIIYVTALEHETSTVSEGGKFLNLKGELKEVKIKDETLRLSTESMGDFEYIIHATVYNSNKESSGRMFEYKYDSTKDEIERVYMDTIKPDPSKNQ